MRWTLMVLGRTRLMRTAKSCGPGASTLASSLAGAILAGRRRQNSPIPGESTKETVKTIAQGRPGRSGEPVVTMLVYFVFYRTRGCGCIVRPAFPAPSLLRGPTASGKTRAKNMRRERERLSSRHCEERSDEAIQRSACRAMDCFASLAMTIDGYLLPVSPAAPARLPLAERWRPCRAGSPAVAWIRSR